MKNIILGLKKSTLLLITALCASLIKLSPIFGTFASFFSITQIASPLAGALGGPFLSLAIYAIRTLIFGATHTGLAVLFYHLPTLFAGLYLATHNKFAKALIPVLCMLAFIAHPVGGQAFAYSFYWLIPLFIAINEPNSFFFKSLGATFTAHAVGSVIFIYTKTTVATFWYALLPVVALERLVFAAGMTTLFITINYAKKIVVSHILLMKNPGNDQPA